jgi:Leucine-rich repeat (LRR) protein
MSSKMAEDKAEDEEPAGPQILDVYLFYLHGNPSHLEIESKKALRLCCKKFKYFFDASIDDALVLYRDDERVRAEFNGKFIRFEISDVKATYSIPKSFTSLDLTCQMLPSLKALNVTMLTVNPLDGFLPESIGKLTSLTKLRVVMPSDLSLPSSFSQLTLLESLTFETSPTSFEVLSPLMGFEALVDLNLQVLSAEMVDLGDFLLNFPDLKSVDLRGVGGDVFPISENIGCLQLTQLVLRLQNIPSLPESLGDMSTLIWLDLGADEGLKTLPASLGNLTGLELLALRCAELTALPESMGNLKSLKVLQLEECGSLIRLPDSLTRLPLEFFAVRDCDQLVEPPETLLQQFGMALYYISKVRVLSIIRGEMIEALVEDESSDWGTDEDNDSDIFGSQAGDHEFSE